MFESIRENGLDFGEMDWAVKLNMPELIID
jgi:hypothetical protein